MMSRTMKARSLAPLWVDVLLKPHLNQSSITPERERPSFKATRSPCLSSVGVMKVHEENVFG